MDLIIYNENLRGSPAWTGLMPTFMGWLVTSLESEKSNVSKPDHSSIIFFPKWASQSSFYFHKIVIYA
jgi:hypothetical protein